MEKKLTRAEEKASEAYPIKMTPLVYQDLIDQFGGKTEIDVNTYPRCLFQEGYEQAEKDIKEAIIKHFKYKQDHSPEHTLHWWVYKNVIDKVNEL